MVHREYNLQLDAVGHHAKHDSHLLAEQHEQLQQKYQHLRSEFDEQKEFYERALETRF